MSEELLSMSGAESLPAGFTEVVDPITHYQVEGNRYWDISQAAFVDSLPEEFKLGKAPDRSGKLSIASLKDALMSQNLDMGELANSEEAKKFYAKRHELLQEFKEVAEPSTWLQLSAATQAAWVSYYDALMDLPNAAEFPWDGENIPWPAKPITTSSTTTTDNTTSLSGTAQLTSLGSTPSASNVINITNLSTSLKSI